jgi:RND family efflux transporter MFP subunit
MKTLFKSMVIAGAVVMTAACGGSDKQAQNSKAAVDTTPTVSVEQVTRRDVPQEVVYSTTVQAFVKNNIAPQSVNRIAQINVEIGDNVTKGQVLAKMDQVQLQTVENQMKQAELQMKNNEVEYGRLKGLYDAGGLSQSDLDAIELGYEASKIAYNNAKKQYENLKENSVLLSPINGVVTARNYDAGDMYAMTAPIFTVEQISPVKLLVGVSESDYSKVHVGDEVKVAADALPGQEFVGKINRIYPTVDPATRTFTIEVVVPNNFSTLRPGMFTRVTVNFGINRNVVIPDVAVVKQQGSGERFVYILNEDGTVSYQKIVLGRRMGTEYEVLEGLSDGAKIVTGGQIRLKDGIKVAVNE